MPEKCYQKNPDLVYRKIADEVILVPIKKNVGDLESIYTLNESAARIWELIDGKRGASHIRDELVRQFEISEEVAERDLMAFIEQLKSDGMVREV
ncbi:MAG: PqqD family protein [Candidatus Omnitrophica bacterium]|nr:PqqD family protein [Candidatus Omnitrophota bacterium]MBU1869914.1 PqqD family protein [Candidatus Omnitrophota bacterium]